MCKLLTVVCLALLSSVSNGQQSAECVLRPSEPRIPCNGGTVDRNACSRQEGQVRCCYSDTGTIKCYAPRPSNAATLTTLDMRALTTLEPVPTPDNYEPVTTAARRLTGVDPEVSSEVEGRALNFGAGNLVGLAVNFPACVVPTPFCHRSRCNSQNPAAETNPFQCTMDPSCCFDRDLFVYKYIFGPTFMGGAPVCYYGPTSSRYRQIAQSIRPWNPFFQEVVVDIFEAYLDSGFDFNQRLLCLTTNLLGSTPFFQTPKCGWRGITKLQCHLKGCCYNDDENECTYPHESLPNDEFYPELIANSPDESTCASRHTFHPNIYRRLPCRCPDNGTYTFQDLFTCPRQSCCANPFALIPQLADLSILASASNAGPIPFSPFLLTQNVDLSSLPNFFCPYFFLPFAGLPDLTLSLVDCCKQHGCYHLKRGSGPRLYQWSNWGSWSPCVGQCGRTGQRARLRQCTGFNNLPSNQCVGLNRDPGSCTPTCPASWTQWGQWGGCNAGCGGSGTEARSRQCRFPNGQSSSTCPGSATQRRPCNRQCASWTQWGQWGGCNAGCGGSGTEARSRQCRFPNGQSSSTCPGSATQRRPCNRQCASWTQWGQWGGCNAGCGGSGTEARSRQCRFPNGQSSSTCPGSATQRRPCNRQCASWTQWGQWGSCNAGCGGSGTEARSRQCRFPNGQSSSTCPGSATQRRSCNSQCASWTQWGQWGNCNAACGGSGTETRSRECRLPNGQTSNTCGGSSTQNRNCQGPPCYSWSQWNQWTGCTTLCNRQRVRDCRDRNGNPSNENNCPGEAVEEESCTGGTCLQDPPPSGWVSWGVWVNWSGCSATCGGQQYRERVCLYRGNVNTPIGHELCACAYGDSLGRRQDRSCNNNPCPAVTEWTQWSPFSTCTQLCKWSRSRRCVVSSTNQQVNSSLCPGSDVDNQDCDNSFFTNWTSWGPCSRECGGTQVRARCCSTDTTCSDPRFGSQSCNARLDCP